MFEEPTTSPEEQAAIAIVGFMFTDQGLVMSFMDAYDRYIDSGGSSELNVQAIQAYVIEIIARAYVQRVASLVKVSNEEGSLSFIMEKLAQLREELSQIGIDQRVMATAFVLEIARRFGRHNSDNPPMA